MPKVPICLLGPSNYFKGGLTDYTQHLLKIFSYSSSFSPSAIFLNKFIPKRLFPGKNRSIKDFPLKIPASVRYYNGLDWYLLPSMVESFQFLSSLPKNQVFILQWWSSSVLHLYLLFVHLVKIFYPRSTIIIEIHEVFDPLEQRIKLLHGYVKYFLPLLLNKADYVFFHSPEEAVEFSTRFKLTLSSIHFVKHIFPVTAIDTNPKQANDPTGITILFFGLIRDYKGIPLLLNSFNLLLDSLDPAIASKVVLQIVGEIWDDKRTIYSLIQHSPHRESIFLQNRYIPDAEIPKYFSAASLLVLPYLRGTQSGVLNLGMNYSLPIVASRVGGFAEALADYEPKFLVEPNDVKALEATLRLVITKLASSPSDLKRSSTTLGLDVNALYVNKVLNLTTHSHTK